MANAIVGHHLHTTQLPIACVHLTPEEFIQGHCTGQDDMRVLDLNNPLAQAHEVSANPDCAAGDNTQGEALLIGPIRLPGNHCRAMQILHGDVKLLTDYINQLVALLALLHHLLAVN